MAAAPRARSAAPPGARGLIVFGLAMAGGLALCWRLRALLLLLYAAALFTVLIDPLVAALQRRRLSRGAAIASVVLLAMLAVLLLGRLALPVLLAELSGLAARWPQVNAAGLATLEANPWMKRLPLAELAPSLSLAGGWMLRFAGQLAGFLADSFTVLLLTVYMLAEGETALAWSLSWAPAARRARLAVTLRRAAARLRGWLSGQLLLAAIMIGLASVVFGAMRLPDFFLLALLLGALTFVPILGPIAGALVAGGVAATQSWDKAAGVMVFYAAHQLFDNGYLTPRVMRNAINLPGLAIIVALAAGASLGGAVGALLAVPTAALLAEMAAEYGGRS